MSTRFWDNRLEYGIMNALVSEMASRITAAVERGGGRAAVSNATGIPVSTLDRYMKGETEPQASKLADLSKVCGVSVQWLVFGTGDPSILGHYGAENESSDAVLIPLLNVEGSAGPGSENGDVEIIEQISFSREFLNRERVKAENAHFITARGDSMSPTIVDGSLVLVDASVERVKSDGIYVLVVDGDVRVKRVQKSATGGLTLISENPIYQSETLAPDDAGKLRIVGRVFWTGRPL